MTENTAGERTSTESVEDAREGQSTVRFGECASCFNGLERPFWDSLCFACQDSLDDLDDMEDFDD